MGCVTYLLVHGLLRKDIWHAASTGNSCSVNCLVAHTRWLSLMCFIYCSVSKCVVRLLAQGVTGVLFWMLFPRIGISPFRVFVAMPGESVRDFALLTCYCCVVGFIWCDVFFGIFSPFDWSILTPDAPPSVLLVRALFSYFI